MDMVVRRTINDYCNEIKSQLLDNALIKKMFDLTRKLNLNSEISFKEEATAKDIFVNVSITVFDKDGSIYLIPEESDYYDDLGSLGGVECILRLKLKTRKIYKFGITNELFDDIALSIEYLENLNC